jgi:sugar phosphate isomerase/epimerase
MESELSRRDFMGRTAAGMASIYSGGALAGVSSQASRPDSTINGVKIGTIAPYSFRNEVSTADEVLQRLLQLGLSWVELQTPAIEQYAGAPPPPPRATGAGGQQPSPEQQATAQRATEALRRWRLSASMDKFRELRAKYEAAGVVIDVVKFPVGVMGPIMTDDEVDYAFGMSRALGASVVNTELPPDETKRLARLATKHKMMLGYHGHGQVNSVAAFARPGSWEQSFFYSPFHGANVDIGHFTAGNNESPLPFIREYHDRITSLHIKDRKKNNGPAVPFGEGDTPIREVLRLMRDEKYPFQATIELEYPIPQGSTVMAEMQRCIQFCKDALSS